MSNIEFLIRYEREGTKLDFKREQYNKEKYQDLLKDIMAMANAPIEGKRYIIVGVKEKTDGSKEFHSIPKDEIVDQATYQQIVRENIEPHINFSYYSIELDGNILGIIEIDKCDNPPYMMKKDYRALKKGECLIRRGSQQERMTRRDLEEILQFKSHTYFDDKISIGFNKNFDQKLTMKAVREYKLPSSEAKEKIESILKKRKKESKLIPNNHYERLGLNITAFRSPFQNVPYEERTTEELEKNLKDVQETYRDDDWYYIGEEMSEKINFIMRNDGTKYLEDVSIEFKIPIELVDVMDRVHSEPKSFYESLNVSNITSLSNNYYPNVIEEDGYYIIHENIGALKHHQDTEVFNEHLRVFFGQKSFNKSFTWSYTIYAKNLPTPIKGDLIVEVI
ncbi:ATP-binding protein [Sporosarcina ureae]|uniref:ATP-binding protein n=1 Tax=Sporosarcina ureae TaxID=1571 RepID=UPI0026F1284A|nr:ATP-binding protein [Sporosarcina ureae]